MIRVPDLLIAGMPNEKLKVVAVETIQIGRMAGPFTGGPEGDLAQSTDFQHGLRDLSSFGPIDPKVVVLDEKVFRRKGR